ncbi:MAG: histidine kinase, partial [Chloroflexi bacterium]|nr:histidine kinase [Chloroflexota bacterium]
MEGQLPIPRATLVRPRRRDEVLERLFRASVAVCVLVTLMVLLPGVHGHAVMPTVDLVLDTVALLVSVMLTLLAWARFRERRAMVAVYHAAAFLALSMAYGIALIVSLEHSGSIGSLAEPENAQGFVFAVASMAAAILFVIAGVFTGRRTYGWHPALIIAVPSLAVVGTGLVTLAVDAPPDALQIIRFDDSTGLPHITPFGATVNLVTAGLFFVGAYVSRGMWRRDHSIIDGWIAIALVFAGFGELHWAIYPGAHPGQVSTGDLFRLGSFLALLLGLESAVRTGLRELRAANVELAALRDADVERAALEERARLARELHDGLAQDLWLAKLRTGQVAAMDGLPPEAKRAVEEAASA